ncbi:RrF2 family transcriptional regulator [Brevibacillus daliensis]|uniref:RrF2 family transcriptional regulator n=1 Tax=Brevibacillus daliensis TaxID=2892995 RepID=UPI001E3715EC|nr:Rrf2 family transcriptional regulator [Brevibacillus daliensis]
MRKNRIDQIGLPRFRIAIHTLVWLAQSNCLRSSAVIASRVQSHATFLRRVLADLYKAGIVEAKEGRDGGYFLKVAPEELTLAEIYTAIKDEEKICNPSETIKCGDVGRQLDLALENIIDDAEVLLIEHLKKFTILDVMEGIDFSKCNEKEK